MGSIKKGRQKKTTESWSIDRPEDSENAAVELKKVFGLLTLGSDEMYSPGKASGKLAAQYTDVLELHEHGVDTPYSDEQMAQLSEAFANPDFPRIFQLFTGAAAKDACVFERNYGDGPEMPIPELVHYRSVCILLTIRAKYEAQVGNRDAALRLVRESLIIGDLLKTEPILISQLVRLASLQVSLKALRSVSARQELTD